MHRHETSGQAEGLRRLTRAGGVKVIAVASGKGGVGKTNVSVNLSVALARAGCSTLLMDADLGLANVDVLLGLNPAVNLTQVMNGELDLEGSEHPRDRIERLWLLRTDTCPGGDG